MSETMTDRRLRLCVPRGQVDSTGLSLDRLAGSLAESNIDVAGVDAVELVFEDVETPQAAIELLDELANNSEDAGVGVQELVVELHR
jgi:hypothetical protein